MIIVRLKGGLGNQLFQFYYSILHSGQTEKIYLETSFYKNKFAEDYAGSELLLKSLVKTSDKYAFVNLGLGLGKIFWKFSNFFRIIFRLINIKIYDGHFTEEFYYREKGKELKTYLELDQSKIQLNIRLEDVLIHVRRGDYTNSINSKIYFNCDLNYFLDAIEKMNQLLPSPKFFVMTNDVTWAKENFHDLKQVEVLDIQDPLASFQVMCMFKNFIISNSTFSWWAAMLSGEGKIIAPQKWFLDEKKNVHLYPPKWIKI